MQVVEGVLRFLRRGARRVALTLLGIVLLVAGAVMLVTPGPGIVTIVAGLAVLAREYRWARLALDRARGTGREMARRSQDALRRAQDGRASRRGPEAP